MPAGRPSWPTDCVLFLRSDVAAAGCDRAEFVFTDAAVENFLFARRGIKVPFAVYANYRDGHIPILGTDLQNAGIFVGGDQNVFRFVGTQEMFPIGLVLDGIAGRYDFFGFVAENCDDFLMIAGLQRGDERFHSVVWSRKGFLFRG